MRCSSATAATSVDKRCHATLALFQSVAASATTGAVAKRAARFCRRSSSFSSPTSATNALCFLFAAAAVVDEIVAADKLAHGVVGQEARLLVRLDVLLGHGVVVARARVVLLAVVVVVVVVVVGVLALRNLDVNSAYYDPKVRPAP